MQVESILTVAVQARSLHLCFFRKYINCQFGVNPVELGCTDGLIFDHTINKCVNPEEGPADWYELNLIQLFVRQTFVQIFVSPKKQAPDQVKFNSVHRTMKRTFLLSGTDSLSILQQSKKLELLLHLNKNSSLKKFTQVLCQYFIISTMHIFYHPM